MTGDWQRSIPSQIEVAAVETTWETNATLLRSSPPNKSNRSRAETQTLKAPVGADERRGAESFKRPQQPIRTATGECHTHTHTQKIGTYWQPLGNKPKESSGLNQRHAFAAISTTFPSCTHTHTYASTCSGCLGCRGSRAGQRASWLHAAERVHAAKSLSDCLSACLSLSLSLSGARFMLTSAASI